MDQDDKLMYQGCPYLSDEDTRDSGWGSSRPIWWGGWGPNWYGQGWGHGWGQGWHGGHGGGYGGGHGGGHGGWHGGGHGGHGGHRDYEEDERHDCGKMYKSMPCPMPVQPIVTPKEFVPIEKNVNITEINNTIIQIEKRHPYLMKKLLMLGLAEAECKKILYLVLLCCGKFDL